VEPVEVDLAQRFAAQVVRRGGGGGGVVEVAGGAGRGGAGARGHVHGHMRKYAHVQP